MLGVARRCRVLLGRALRLLGDEASALGELTEIAAAFAYRHRLV